MLKIFMSVDFGGRVQSFGLFFFFLTSWNCVAEGGGGGGNNEFCLRHLI
jgi:hypothetical protein